MGVDVLDGGSVMVEGLVPDWSLWMAGSYLEVVLLEIAVELR